MKAAVVTSFDTPPRYEDIDAPTPGGPADVVVDVVAAGLHPRVRSQADGSHYTSTDELPLIPGIDGVGRGPDKRLRYFVLPDTTRGSMAERTVVDERRSILLPEEADVIALAAAMNPAMSSWVALRRRLDFRAGRRVLDADPDTVAGQLAEDARDVDVVLDYLWGEPAVRAMVALVTAPESREKPLTWVQIGSVAGRSAAIPSAALRAPRLEIVGSGQGSVTTAKILAELRRLPARSRPDASPSTPSPSLWPTSSRSGGPTHTRTSGWSSSPDRRRRTHPSLVISRNSVRTRAWMSSRMRRTVSTGCPAGSSSSQSS